MSFKKILCVLCCALLCLTFTACNSFRPDGTPPDGNNNLPDNVTGGEITDNNDVTITDPKDTGEHDFDLISQAGGTFTYKCADCNEEETVVISYVSGTKNAYSVNENTITFSGITEASAFDISGTFHGNIVIDVTEDYKFELQMCGLQLYSHTACPITVLSGDKVTLSAKKSTENYIYDMRETVSSEEISASVYALCDLNVQGKGTLNIKSTNNNGIHTKVYRFYYAQSSLRTLFLPFRPVRERGI